MIPPNIKARLEEMEKLVVDVSGLPTGDMRLEFLRHGYNQASFDLWLILTEGPLEFDETSAHEAGVRLTQRFAGYVEKPGHELETLQINSTIDGARWQFNILKPKMMAMELEMKHMRDQYVKDAKMMESQKLEIERLNVKSMAMEAEIQRLRGTLRKVEPGPLTEEELKWIEEDERG